MFSYEYCEIFKNFFFLEHLRWLLLKGLIKALSIIYYENSEQVRLLTIFTKKDTSYILDKVLKGGVSLEFPIEEHAFFISNTFINNARQKLVKDQANPKQP